MSGGKGPLEARRRAWRSGLLGGRLCITAIHERIIVIEKGKAIRKVGIGLYSLNGRVRDEHVGVLQVAHPEGRKLL